MLTALAQALGLAPRASDSAPLPGPADDYWYRPLSGFGPMGVGPDTAMRQFAVYQAVTTIARDVASLPLFLYRRKEKGGKERAADHPLYPVLHDQPNPGATSQQFLQTAMAAVLRWGFAPSEILRGRRGAVTGLLPLDPALVTPELLPTGRRRYKVQDRKTGQTRMLSQDDVFVIPGLSLNGQDWLSPVAYMRELMSQAFAQDNYLSTFYRNNGTPTSGVISLEKMFSNPKDRETFREELQKFHTGVNRHKFMVLEGNGKYTEVAMKHTDAQFLETMKFTARQIYGIYGVPPHRVGDLERATNNNIEHQSLEYVIYCLRPWLIATEQAIKFSLLAEEDDSLFAEFNVDALLRGDILTRYRAHQIAILTGFKNRNEVRDKENENPEEGLDEFLVPQNMAIVGEEPAEDAGGTLPGPGGGDGGDGGDNEERPPNGAASDEVSPFIHDAAARALTRERNGLTTLAKRKANDVQAFHAEASRFYSEHEVYLMDALHISEEAATGYCSKRLDAIISAGIAATETWTTEPLIALAQTLETP